jgi:hypothetical protein
MSPVKLPNSHGTFRRFQCGARRACVDCGKTSAQEADVPCCCFPVVPALRSLLGARIFPDGNSPNQSRIQYLSPRRTGKIAKFPWPQGTSGKPGGAHVRREGRPWLVPTRGGSDRVIHLEFDRVRRVLEIVHLFPLQLDIRFDEIAAEHIAFHQKGVIGLQFAQRIAQ